MKIDYDDTITILDKGTTPLDALTDIANSTKQIDSFFVMDIDDVVRKYNEWTEKLPNVKPFYAVKCNDSKVVLQILAGLGTGFDCASKSEISKMLDLGVAPENIIFANPTKIASHIKYAARHGVDLMTFDSSTELQKIKAYHPNAKLVLRLLVDDSSSQFPLGAKFGADASSVGPLLKLASALGLVVVGVSFHVGSGCGDPAAYTRAVADAARAVRTAKAYGFSLEVVDIGGGFLGETEHSIDKVVDALKKSLEDEFPTDDGAAAMTFIAEPGRYFVASAYTLACAIHGVRPGGRGNGAMYYIADGVFGSFGSILLGQAVRPTPLKVAGERYPSTVWGPTCDSLDCVTRDCHLPKMEVGDWLVFQDMGAYTTVLASGFNGFATTSVFHVATEGCWNKIRESVRCTIGRSGGEAEDCRRWALCDAPAAVLPRMALSQALLKD